jgi:hypothetical protein
MPGPAKASAEAVNAQRISRTCSRRPGFGPNIDGVWNLVLACDQFNADKGGKRPLLAPAFLVVKVGDLCLWTKTLDKGK